MTYPPPIVNERHAIKWLKAHASNEFSLHPFPTCLGLPYRVRPIMVNAKNAWLKMGKGIATITVMFGSDFKK